MKGEISRRRVIRLGAALGAATATSAVLAACGDKASGSSAGPAKKASGTGQGSKTSGGKVIARKSKVAPGSAIGFTDSGQPAVLIHLKDGRFVAYSAICTHMGCTVGYDKGNDMLVCPCHGSVFDPAHGAKVLQGPAPSPLPTIAIKVKGGKVYLA